VIQRYVWHCRSGQPLGKYQAPGHTVILRGVAVDFSIGFVLSAKTDVPTIHRAIAINKIAFFIVIILLIFLVIFLQLHTNEINSINFNKLAVTIF